jgi:multidrug efflux pump subunit AcrB
VQTPERSASSLNDLKNTPVGTFTASNGNPVPRLLSNVAALKRDSTPTNANQANIQPVYEVYANAQGRDLGPISGDVDKIVAQQQKQLSPGNRIEVIGQIDSMNSAFRDMAIGILFAAVFVYLLMVINYQTWGNPFVVILALPATLCGIVTMLFVTGTTVLMTAAAMIAGMIPMAIGGPGEEQNAALARAVVGSLLFATPTTLLIVPYLFAMLRKCNDGKPAHGVFAEEPQ